MAKRNKGSPLAVKARPRKRVAKASGIDSARVAASLYSVHPGVAMLQKWIAELPMKTGRSLVQWISHIKDAGPETEKDCRLWLQEQYKLKANTAWWLAEKVFGDPQQRRDDTPDGYLALAPKYVEQMYAGVREALRPIHDEVIAVARRLGEQVRICPCQTMVPLYRRHVFAQIKPATNKRIDLGLALGEEPFTSRLRDTGGLAKKDRITHCVSLTSLTEIDLQVKRWLKQAYERDG
jgi:uncharacterized protein DUF5655